MFKKLSILLAMVVMLSCQHEEQVTTQLPGADIEARDGRLYFANEELYADKLTELELMEPAAKQSWINQYSFKPLQNILRNVKDADAFAKAQNLEGLAPAHWLVLNENRTIQFGDDVVYFGDGLKHYMSVSEYNNLADKRDIRNSTRTAFYGSKTTVSDEDAAAGRYMDAWHKGDIGWGGSQHEFGYNNMNYKFTDEWYSKTEQIGLTTNSCGDPILRSRLYLYIILEQKPNGYFQSWSTSSAERSYSFNINFSGFVCYYGFHRTSDCAYIDAVNTGPTSCPVCPNQWAGNFQGYSVNNSTIPSSPWVTSRGEFLIGDTGNFNAEKHATYDLKKWEGTITSGTVTQTFRVNNHSYTDTFTQDQYH